ncbi:MAG: hypothetical protein DRO12_06020 [Thermoprotei archaeon]|nr:MAG: hypothetical protein DRO12_06020 [Thermoprotei archaeon]
MAYTLGDILNSILTAVQDVLGNIATAIADNAGIIATMVVLGGLTYAVVRYGTRIFRSVTGWIGTLF